MEKKVFTAIVRYFFLLYIVFTTSLLSRTDSGPPAESATATTTTGAGGAAGAAGAASATGADAATHSAGPARGH